MSRGTRTLKKELVDGMRVLERLFDEVELTIHLASMDARDTWKSLRAEAEKAGREMSAAGHRNIEEAIHRVKEFQKSIESGGASHEAP
jgi:hypothetical protein